MNFLKRLKEIIIWLIKGKSILIGDFVVEIGWHEAEPFSILEIHLFSFGIFFILTYIKIMKFVFAVSYNNIRRFHHVL